MPPLLYFALLVATSLLLMRRGRLALGLLVLPTAYVVDWGSGLGWGEALRSAGWLTGAGAWTLLAASLLLAPLRARVLGRKHYRRALLALEQSSREAQGQPSDLERWSAAGRPLRARVRHAREPLEDRPVEIERALDETLGRLGNEGPSGRLDLTPAEWSELGSTGLLAAGIDVEYGGLGATPLALSDLVARSAGRSLSVAEVIAESGPGGFADLVATFGADKQRETLLPRLARGEALGALSWTGINLLPGESFATIVKDPARGKSRLAARLQFAFDAVELAPRAAFVAIVLPTFDPDGLVEPLAKGESPGRAGEEARTPESSGASIGATCFLVPVGGAGIDCKGYNDPVGSALPKGRLESVDVSLPIDHVLGGIEGFGEGDRVRRRSLELRAGWRTPAIACGVAEYAARVAGNVAAVDRSRRETHDAALGSIAAELTTIDALRRAACARLDRGPGGATLLGAGSEALRLSRRTIEHAFEATGPQSGVRGAAAALKPLESWLASSSAELGSWARSRTWLVVERGLSSVALDGAEEAAALRAQDRVAFERVRWHRSSRQAALWVSVLWRALLRLSPLHRPVSRTAAFKRDLDHLGRAFALAAETFVRGSRAGDPGAHARAARGLGRGFEGILRMLALEESRDVDAGSTVQKAIRREAHSRALAHGWRGVLAALSGLRGGLRLSLIRAAVSALAPARRVADTDGTGAAADEFLSSYDVRQGLTSNVFVQGAHDLDVGALEHAARIAYAAERPLRQIEAAIALGQLPPLDVRNSTELERLAREAAELSIVSDADRESVLLADSLARGLRGSALLETSHRQRDSA